MLRSGGITQFRTNSSMDIQRTSQGSVQRRALGGTRLVAWAVSGRRWAWQSLELANSRTVGGSYSWIKLTIFSSTIPPSRVVPDVLEMSMTMWDQALIAAHRCWKIYSLSWNKEMVRFLLSHNDIHSQCFFTLLAVTVNEYVGTDIWRLMASSQSKSKSASKSKHMI